MRTSSRVLRGALIAPLVITLAACAVSIDPTPRRHGLDLPEAWSAAEATDDQNARVRAEWWREFDDPALHALIERAFSHNRDLAAAAARLARAIAETRAAGAEQGPALDARFDSSRSRQNFIGLPIPGSSGVLSNTSSNFGLGLDLSWELDLWGRLRAATARAQYDLDAVGADYAGARLSLAGQTAKAWFALVEARAQTALAAQTAELFERSTARIRARFERGTRTALDLRLARTELETARAALAQRRGTEQRLARALQVLTGSYPDGDVRDGASLPAIPGAVPAGLPASILSRRPDLVAAERRLAAADAGLAEARADLYPRLSLTASGGTRSADIDDLFDGDFRVWSIAGNLVGPIFDSGRRQARIEVRDAVRHEALATWAESVLRAISEVESLLASETHLDTQLEHVAAAAEEAVGARTLSDERYGRGLIDIVTLLTAQRREVDARSQLLALQRQQLDTRIDLLLALGGGFGPPDEPAPDASEETP